MPGGGEDARQAALLSFVVPGIPRSLQSRSRTTWTAKVRGAAATAWQGRAPFTSPLSVTIVYFYKDGSVDVDNMIKPILDALVGLVVVDDALVIQVTARKTELAPGLSVRNASTELVTAINRGSDFIYVKVLEPPDHRIMP